MATVPTPATQVAGTVVPAATVNSQGNLANYLAGRTESGGARRPLARLRQTVAQSIPASTFTAVTFDVEDVDYDNGHSVVTNTSRYTAQTAGWYDVDAMVAFASSATGVRMATFFVNGVQGNGCQLESGALAAFPWCGHLSFAVFLNVNDYLELAVWQNTGGALNTAAAATQSCAMVVKWASV